VAKMQIGKIFKNEVNQSKVGEIRQNSKKRHKKPKNVKQEKFSITLGIYAT